MKLRRLLDLEEGGWEGHEGEVLSHDVYYPEECRHAQACCWKGVRESTLAVFPARLRAHRRDVAAVLAVSYEQKSCTVAPLQICGVFPQTDC